MSDGEVLAVAAKYEHFIAYLYPILQNIPRRHGTAKNLVTTDVLSQQRLFYEAAKSGQVGKLHAADAGLANLRFWLRFLRAQEILTQRQHQTAAVLITEVGKMLGAWTAKVNGRKRSTWGGAGPCLRGGWRLGPRGVLGFPGFRLVCRRRLRVRLGRRPRRL